jgi:hypothetical protein
MGTKIHEFLRGLQEFVLETTGLDFPQLFFTMRTFGVFCLMGFFDFHYAPSL